MQARFRQRNEPGKNCRTRHEMPGQSAEARQNFQIFQCPGFGTQLARQLSANVSQAASWRHEWSSAMLFALGAASSILEGLQSIGSSKSSSSGQSGNSGNTGSGLFDLLSGSQAASNLSPTSSSTTSGAQISSQTMSALIAAQGD